MMRPLLTISGGILLLLILLISLTLLPRLNGLTAAQQRLAACEAPCHWEWVDTRDLRVGDVLVALGAPYGISMVGTPLTLENRLAYLREELFYPDRALVVTIANAGDSAPIGPHTAQGLTLSTAGSPAMSVPWHGFTTLCRYYPNAWPQCVHS